MWRAILPVAIALPCCAQTPNAPEFEVAEVRVSPPIQDGSQITYSTSNTGRLAQIRLSGASAQVTPVFAPNGRVTMRYATMRELISAAYTEILGPGYLTGGPRWIDSDRFDLVAKAPAADTPIDTQRLMLQSVLARRFHLEIHRENKPMPVYALVVAKSGPKLRPSDNSTERDGCLPVRGYKGEGIHRSCHNVTMAVLADRLPRMAPSQVDRPVVDMTGLSGAYDFDLEWIPMMSATDMPGATIFFALEKQAGLKLEERRQPMPTIVIDRVDRTPAEN